MSPRRWFGLVLLSGLLVVPSFALLGWTRAPAPLPRKGAKEIINSIGMKLVLIPAGRFKMGSPKDEPERAKDEGPQHEVEITKPFYLGSFEVTQHQYRTVMGNNPSSFRKEGGAEDVKGQDTDRFPVESLNWEEPVEFCKRLSGLPKEKRAGRVYRLPTEAEWEYACRAGTTTPFHFGVTLSAKEANFDATIPYDKSVKGVRLQRTCKVGSYKPNAWGLYDMHGNVQEMCSDWYAKDYYGKSPRMNPRGPDTGTGRVSRGGGYITCGNWCRSASRGDSGGVRAADTGFRVALGLPIK